MMVFNIIGASKGIYPVLAYSDNGSFTEDTDIPGLSAWIDFTKEKIENSLVNTKSSASFSDEIIEYELLKEMFASGKNTTTRVMPDDPGTTRCFNEIRNYSKAGPS